MSRAGPVSDASDPIYRRILTDRNGGAMQVKTAVAIGLLVVAGSATVPASASGPKLSVRAARLEKVDPTTWTGKAVSPQLGAGRLTLTGNITFNDTDADDPNHDTQVIRFRATFKKGWMRGCFVNNTLLRPGNRQVWDGVGRVTATAAALRRYRGIELGEGGVTPADDTTYAKPFGFSAQDRPGKPGC
jgi:hypothetical protein